MCKLHSPVLPVLLSCFLGVFTATGKSQDLNVMYNKQLADSLGGDDNGMKRYVLVILKTGTSEISEKSIIDSLFRGHMRNINRMVHEGKLVVAGPLQKNEKSYRGIFVLNVKTIEEAKMLVDTDPAIKEKLLDAELYSWYGSAALPMYLQYQKQVKKTF